MPYEYKGPLLREHVCELLKQRGYTSRRCSKEFRVGISWFTELKQGRRINADKLQEVLERLTGAPLIRD